jgi:threonine/homoserine/homoserine lactone efflux protein
MNIELFTAFVLITVILILTPGPIVTLVIATGATHGVRAALVTVAGTAIGNALLLAGIALGLSWILKNAVELFEIMRWAGVVYLVYLGVQAWRHAGEGLDAPPPSRRVHFRRGLIVALTNPKTIAFFTAFLPQFIDSTLPADFQLFVMCATSVLIAWTIDSGWAVAAGMGRAFFMKPSRAKLLGRLSGTVLIGGGIWLALARRPG